MQKTDAENGATFQTLQEVRGGWKYRWVLEYVSGVKKHGAWGGDYDDKALKASEQNLNGLLRAYIEGMDPCRVYQKAVECPAADFCMFQWVHEGRVNGYGKVQSRIVGMSLVTTTEKVTMLENGTAEIEARPKDEQHNQFQYGGKS